MDSSRGKSLVGPLLVMSGASMWGLETYWRLALSRTFAADVLVFHEHWIGLVLTLPFLVWGARRLRTVSWRGWTSMLLSGVLGSALGTVCFTRAITLMNPSVANLLLNVQPLVSVAVSWVWLGERPRASFYPWAGVALLCGLALAWPTATLPSGGSGPLLSPDHVLAALHGSRLGLGLLFIAATAFCWGASTTFGRGAMLEIDFRTGVSLRYAIGAVATFGVLAAGGLNRARVNAAALGRPKVLENLLLLLLVAAITPTFLYFAGLARTKASVATFAEMGQTLAALVITWGTLGYGLNALQVAAGALLLVAVALIHRSAESVPAPQPAEAEVGLAL